jgi:hypothetical protein
MFVHPTTIAATIAIGGTIHQLLLRQGDQFASLDLGYPPDLLLPPLKMPNNILHMNQP